MDLCRKNECIIHTIELDMAHSNYYVVTMTDENFGIAVSVCTWIIEKCLELLHKDEVPVLRNDM